jgi:hypothetical protein
MQFLVLTVLFFVTLLDVAFVKLISFYECDSVHFGRQKKKYKVQKKKMLAEDATNDSTFTNQGDPLPDTVTSDGGQSGEDGSLNGNVAGGDASAVPGVNPSPSVHGTSRVSNPLTQDLVAQHISLLAKTGNGLSHAFVKLELRAKNVTSIDAIEQFPHLRYVVC